MNHKIEVKDINGQTVEGRLLIAALAYVSGNKKEKSLSPEAALADFARRADLMFTDADFTPPHDKPKTFTQEIEEVINRHSAEQDSDTPDFILARFVTGCLSVFSNATRARDKWHDFHPFKVENMRRPESDPKRFVDQFLEGAYKMRNGDIVFYPQDVIDMITRYNQEREAGGHDSGEGHMITFKTSMTDEEAMSFYKSTGQFPKEDDGSDLAQV